VGRWTPKALLSGSKISPEPGLILLFQTAVGQVPHQKAVILNGRKPILFCFKVLLIFVGFLLRGKDVYGWGFV